MKSGRQTVKNSIEEITFVENKIKNTRRVFEEVGCHTFFDEDLCEAIEHILSDYKRLLKENEELKDIDLTTVHIKGVCDEKDRWRNKIRELILNKKQKIQENSKEIEECRKTIMEEQELKKLKLYTLHKNNDLLELEIADLFNLLKEE